MSNEKEIKFDVGVSHPHNPQSLLQYLINKYKTKTSGKEFKIFDIHQYMRRGHLPKQYGNNALDIVKERGVFWIKILESKAEEKRGRKKLIKQ